MMVNSSLLNRGFHTAVRISAAAQKVWLESDTIQILYKCPPWVYFRQSVSHSPACAWAGENVQRRRKNTSECTSGSEHFFGLSTLSLDKLNLASYMVPNYCISHALSTSTPLPLCCQACNVGMPGVEGATQERSHLTVTSHLGARQLTFGSIYFLCACMCVSDCVKTSFSPSLRPRIERWMWLSGCVTCLSGCFC